MELALEAGISARHLSFIETGRTRPSAEMVLRLAEQLEVPLRERNHLLLAAGFAPAFAERGMSDPELAPVRDALEQILAAHEPNPAVALDRRWNVVAANSAMAALTAWADPSLLEPPVNAMRVGLHPLGLARWTTNLDEVRAYFLGRLERQVAITADPELRALHEEVAAYAPPAGPEPRPAPAASDEILTPTIRMRLADGPELTLFATVATFGAVAEVTASELSIELAYPADAATAAALRNLPRR
jgi:transcriptional regulator with XRE-family HTH domain